MYTEHIAHFPTPVSVCALQIEPRGIRKGDGLLCRGGGGVLAMCINEHKIQLEFRRFENVVEHCAKM